MGKGAEFERKTARDLTEWLTGQRDEPVLWRSVMSGGWDDAGTPDVGDLRPRQPGGRQEGVDFRRLFAVECKHRKSDLDWWWLFTRSDPKMLRWWREIRSEAREHRISPLLIMRRSRYATLVGFPRYLFPLQDLPDRMIELPSESVRFVDFDWWMDQDVDYIMDRASRWRQIHL